MNTSSTSASVQRTLSSVNPKLVLLETCLNFTHLKLIHAHMIRTGIIDDVFAASRLIASCTKPEFGLSLFDHARRVFSQIQNPNLFVYNSMIRLYSNSENPQRSLQLYSQFRHECLLPDNLTFPFLVKSCARFRSFETGMQIHGQIVIHGFDSDVYAQNTLVHMYATFGDMETANKMFRRIFRPDVVLWTSMISGYTRSGNVEMARWLFDRMPERNVVTWSIMISGYARNCHFDRAIDLFRVLRTEGKVHANETVMVGVISSCAHLGALEQGIRAHDYVVKNKLNVNLILGTALVDMYARCGDINRAVKLFEELPEKDALSWTAVIAGLAMHGHAKRSIGYFIDMTNIGVLPRDITFTAVLNACSHGGLVELGFQIFNSMAKEYDIEPKLEHYGCMVDLLGRAGKIKEAEEFILKMPVNPSPPIWGALLGACCNHRNASIGERVGKILIQLKPDHSGYYVLLSNIYARANRWDRVTELRELMKERGVKKPPGYSEIEIDGTVHRFVIGDNSHPEIEKIEAMWEEIVQKISVAGYTGNTAEVMFDIDEEEKASALYRHSEKLAIAFGIMRTSDRTAIRIAKNLRVCEDCHTATKLVSKVFDRELIVRDRNRFHHFRGGVCSCLDYW